MIVRILRGRKGRISKWFVEVEDGQQRYLVDFDGKKFWNSKDEAVSAGQGWVMAQGAKATFIVPSRDGK